MRERKIFKRRIMFSPLQLLYIKRCTNSYCTDKSSISNKRNRNLFIIKQQSKFFINIAAFACFLTAILFISILSSLSQSSFGALALASSPTIDNTVNEQQVYNHHYKHHHNHHQIISSNSIYPQNDGQENSIGHNHHSRRRQYYNNYATTTISPKQHINVHNIQQNHLLTNEINFDNVENKQGDIDFNNNQNNNEANSISIRQKLTKRKKYEESESNNQQVPEQLPIVVVSSSDNSYVSASPVFTNEETTSTTPTNPTFDSNDYNKDSKESNLNNNASNNDHENFIKDRVNANYHIKKATIIKTRESIDMGATFINYTIVTNLQACLVECWITDSCDTAIYQESPVDFNNHLPYNIPNSKEEHDSLASIQLQHHQGYLNHHKNFDQQHKRSSVDNDEKENNAIENDDEDDDDDDDEDGADNDNDDTKQGDDDDNDDRNIGHDSGNEKDQDSDDDEDVDIDINNDINNYDEYKRLSNIKQSSRKSRKNTLEKHNNNKILDSYNLGFFICYLFQCAKPDGFKCQFSAHNYYVSSVKKEALKLPEKLPNKILPIGFIKTLRPTILDDEVDAIHSSASENNNLHYIVDQSGDSGVLLNRGFNNHRLVEPHYSNIVRDHHQPSINGRRWHDTHVASIKIGQEDYENYAKGGWNSALIAIMFGILATVMIIMVVGHKMNSIKKKIAVKGRRRSIVPDTDFLINTMPTM